MSTTKTTDHIAAPQPEQNAPAPGTVTPLPIALMGVRPDITKPTTGSVPLDLCRARVLSLAEVRDFNHHWAPAQRWNVRMKFEDGVSYLATADPRMSDTNPAIQAVDREIVRFVKTFLTERGVDWRTALDVAFGEEGETR